MVNLSPAAALRLVLFLALAAVAGCRSLETLDHEQVQALMPLPVEQGVEPFAAAELSAIEPTPRERLFEIRIPAGNSVGWSIDLKQGNLGYRTRYFSRRSGLTPEQVAAAAPGSFWLDRGYLGVLFSGAGQDSTHVFAGAADTTIMSEQHPGVVAFEDMTVHCGILRGFLFGFERPAPVIVPEFRYEMYRVSLVADKPTDGRRVSTKWGLHGYSADEYMEDVTVDVRWSGEHGTYVHGYARYGSLRRRVVTLAAGAECDKITWRNWEAAWAPGARAVREDCEYYNWCLPSAGFGGGLVAQGISCDLILKRCIFYNPGPAGSVPSHQRTRALMVDDGGDNNGDGVMDFYSAAPSGVIPAGTRGRGYANGRIAVRECLFFAGPGTESLSHLVRLGNLRTGHLCATDFVMVGCAGYGTRLQVTARDVTPGHTRIAGCNTDLIENYLARRGLDVSKQALIPLADRVVTLEEGLVR